MLKYYQLEILLEADSNSVNFLSCTLLAINSITNLGKSFHIHHHHHSQNTGTDEYSRDYSCIYNNRPYGNEYIWGIQVNALKNKKNM